MDAPAPTGQIHFQRFRKDGDLILRGGGLQLESSGKWPQNHVMYMERSVWGVGIWIKSSLRNWVHRGAHRCVHSDVGWRWAHWTLIQTGFSWPWKWVDDWRSSTCRYFLESRTRVFNFYKNCMEVIMGGTSQMIEWGNTYCTLSIIVDHVKPIQRFTPGCRKWVIRFFNFLRPAIRKWLYWLLTFDAHRIKVLKTGLDSPVWPIRA